MQPLRDLCKLVRQLEAKTAGPGGLPMLCRFRQFFEGCHKILNGI